MSRPTKSAHPLSIRMDDATYIRLTEYCDDTGVPKTVAIEKAVNLYLNEYSKTQEQLKQLKR